MDNFITQMDEMVGRLYEIQTAIEKRRHDYGSGEVLTMRQIHVIEAIGSYPDSNATDLIKKLGLLKGTFSKTTAALESKKLIIRYKRNGNQKDVFYELTPSGKEAYQCHYAYHEARSATVYSIFRKYSLQEQQQVMKFLHDYEDYLNDYL